MQPNAPFEFNEWTLRSTPTPIFYAYLCTVGGKWTNNRKYAGTGQTPQASHRRDRCSLVLRATARGAHKDSFWCLSVAQKRLIISSPVFDLRGCNLLTQLQKLHILKAVAAVAAVAAARGGSTVAAAQMQQGGHFVSVFLSWDLFGLWLCHQLWNVKWSRLLPGLRWSDNL